MQVGGRKFEERVVSAEDGVKGLRIEKKKSVATTNNTTVGTLKRKTSSKGSKKSGGVYNEGAEENKDW